MRTCVWCDAPLPQPEHKGHRRREFCKPPKNCKQRHYLWHKKMQEDATKLAEPYWQTAYMVLVEHYKFLEQRLQERLADLEEERKRVDQLEERVQHYRDQIKDLQTDYAAQLKALGMNSQDIEEFRTYWNKQTELFHCETV